MKCSLFGFPTPLKVCIKASLQANANFSVFFLNNHAFRAYGIEQLYSSAD